MKIIQWERVATLLPLFSDVFLDCQFFFVLQFECCVFADGWWDVLTAACILAAGIIYSFVLNIIPKWQQWVCSIPSRYLNSHLRIGGCGVTMVTGCINHHSSSQSELCDRCRHDRDWVWCIFIINLKCILHHTQTFLHSPSALEYPGASRACTLQAYIRQIKHPSCH